jgi:hypothetical protein
MQTSEFIVGEAGCQNKKTQAYSLVILGGIEIA